MIDCCHGIVICLSAHLWRSVLLNNILQQKCLNKWIGSAPSEHKFTTFKPLPRLSLTYLFCFVDRMTILFTLLRHSFGDWGEYCCHGDFWHTIGYFWATAGLVYIAPATHLYIAFTCLYHVKNGGSMGHWSEAPESLDYMCSSVNIIDPNHYLRTSAGASHFIQGVKRPINMANTAPLHISPRSQSLSVDRLTWRTIDWLSRLKSTKWLSIDWLTWVHVIDWLVDLSRLAGAYPVPTQGALAIGVYATHPRSGK